MRKLSTGEPYAGKPHVRFGGRGILNVSLPLSCFTFFIHFLPRTNGSSTAERQKQHHIGYSYLSKIFTPYLSDKKARALTWLTHMRPALPQKSVALCPILCLRRTALPQFAEHDFFRLKIFVATAIAEMPHQGYAARSAVLAQIVL